MLPLREPKVLIKGEQQCPERLNSIGELNGSKGTLHVHRPRLTQREKEGYDLLPLSVPHRLIKGLHNEMGYRCQTCTFKQWTV